MFSRGANEYHSGNAEKQRDPSHDSITGDEMSRPRHPYLTQEEVASLLRTSNDRPEFDRWRHLPTHELHYYPRGTEPGNRSEYIRFLP
jgi:hypothetical protein